MIGSHNTMTYLRPLKWWQRLIAFTSRCQRKTIEEQYKAGVRYFDFRVKVKRDCNLCYAHGLMEYRYDDDRIEDILWRYPDVKARIVLEKGDKDLFRYHAHKILINYHSQIDYVVDDKKSWHIHWSNRNGYKYYDYYPQYPQDGLIPYPEKDYLRYAKPTDAYGDEIYKNNTVYLFDFI